MPNPATKPMTATERKELRRIISARFELLDQELTTKKKAISANITKQLTDAKATTIAKYERKLAELAAKAQKLNDQSEALGKEIHEAGLTPRGTSAARRSLPVSSWQFASTMTTTRVVRFLAVANIREATDTALSQLLSEHGVASLDLRRLQLNIEEDLALGTLQSQEARDFLSKIPTADKLLPPSAAVAIPASTS